MGRWQLRRLRQVEAPRPRPTELVKWMTTKEFGQMVNDDIKQISAVPGVDPSDPLLKQMSDNYKNSGSPVPAAHRLPLRLTHRHRAARQGPAGAAARLQGRRRGEPGPRHRRQDLVQAERVTDPETRQDTHEAPHRPGLRRPGARTLRGVRALPDGDGVLLRLLPVAGHDPRRVRGGPELRRRSSPRPRSRPTCRRRCCTTCSSSSARCSSRTRSGCTIAYLLTAVRAAAGCCRRSMRCPTSSARSSSATSGRCSCRRRSGRSTRC